MNTVDKPTFRVYDSEHKKKETLIHCFIKESVITLNDYKNLRSFKINGHTYTVVWDELDSNDIRRENGTVEVLISFQKHTYGCFAIIKKKQQR